MPMPAPTTPGAEIVTRSAKMDDLFVARKAGRRLDGGCIGAGESGTGKELLAGNPLHRQQPLATSRFLAINFARPSLSNCLKAPFTA